MGLDGTRGSGRSGRDHNYYLYQTKLGSLASAQHSHSLSREVREDDNGPGNVPPLPLIIHSDNPPCGVKLNMEPVNNPRGARISPISPILADTKVDSRAGGEIVTRCLGPGLDYDGP